VVFILFQKIEKEETLPDSLHKTIINPDVKTGYIHNKEENYRVNSLINVDMKILNKPLAKQIQQHTKKRPYTMTKLVLP
jgi:hypothetical protein